MVKGRFLISNVLAGKRTERRGHVSREIRVWAGLDWEWRDVDTAKAEEIGITGKWRCSKPDIKRALGKNTGIVVSTATYRIILFRVCQYVITVQLRPSQSYRCARWRWCPVTGGQWVTLLLYKMAARLCERMMRTNDAHWVQRNNRISHRAAWQMSAVL